MTQVIVTPAQYEYLKFLVKHKIKEEPMIFITQNQAHKRFGRGNIERWVKTGRVQPYFRPRTVEYKMADLLQAAENHQDYLEL